MRCPSCGQPVARVDRYCAACLAPLPSPEPPPPAASPPAPDPWRAPPALPVDPWASPPAAQAVWGAPPAPPGAPPAWGPGAALPGAGGPAGFWLRLGAMLIDSLVLSVASFAVVLLVGIVVGVGAALGSSEEPSGAVAALMVLSWIVLILGQLAYFAAMESSGRQATLGKLALGLAVTDLQGGRIGLGRGVGRYLAKILSTLPANLGFLLAAFTARKQALHDLVAGTLVVRRRPASVPVVVLTLVVGFFGMVALAGVLAAIAVPNFIRFQLRSKDAEAPALLGSLHGAELAYHAREGTYLELSLPEGEVGREKLPWSEEEAGAAEALGWEARGPTWFTYRVAVGATEEGVQAFATCAEADLDGDGQVAAWVTWQPIELPDGTVAAPGPPCALEPVLERPVELQPGDPAGVPVRVSPRDVF